MKKLLFTLVTMPSIALASSNYIGIAQGKHLVNMGLNDTHLYVGHQTDNIGIVLFNNSFNRLSLATYYDYNSKLKRNISMGIKTGVVTGYKKLSDYNGSTYAIDDRLFITNDLMLMASPYIDYKINKRNKVDMSVVYESINIGYTYSF